MNSNFHEQIFIKTDQELIDIYLNQEEYQPGFVNAAMEELANRNISLDEYRPARAAKEKQIATTLEEGIPGDPLFIALAFVSAFLGGFIGILGGFIYSQSKKDGYYVYNAKTRRYGQVMMLIGVFVLLALLAWRFA